MIWVAITGIIVAVAAYAVVRGLRAAGRLYGDR